MTAFLDLVNDGFPASNLLRAWGSKERVEVHGDLPVLAPRLLEKLCKRWVIRRAYVTASRRATTARGAAPSLLLRGRAHHSDRFSAFFETVRLTEPQESVHNHHALTIHST
ncbi:MAG TPA: hypothetical protein DEV93_01410 [Chloroflexi bacterium]|nr:hypothetical protein [Chloroflexota bacterium]